MHPSAPKSTSIACSAMDFKPSHPNDNAPCCLLQLLGELRNRIYEYALTADDAHLLCHEDEPPIILGVLIPSYERQILSHTSSKPTTSFRLYERPSTTEFNQSNTPTDSCAKKPRAYKSATTPSFSSSKTTWQHLRLFVRALQSYSARGSCTTAIHIESAKSS
jgi:hypothetical protein